MTTLLRKALTENDIEIKLDIHEKKVLSLEGDIVSLSCLKRRLGDFKEWGSQEVIADTYEDRVIDRDGGLTQEELNYLIPKKVLGGNHGKRGEGERK